MSAAVHHPRFQRNPAQLEIVIDPDRAVAREAFRRGLVLGSALEAQRKQGPVAWQPPKPSDSARALRRRITTEPSRLSRHVYVVIFMAAFAALIVFEFHL
jgi:hypothetical protein